METKVEPKITVQRFSANWCPNCKTMKRALTLEKFQAEHPNMKIEEYDLDNPAAEEKADEYGIQGVPAFVFLSDDGFVILKHEGAVSAKMLETVYAKVLAKAEAGDFGTNARPKKRKSSKRPVRKSKSEDEASDDDAEDDEDDE